MAHKCFISFKTEDVWYKEYIQNTLSINMIDKSLDEAINSDDVDYVMEKIREDYLSDSNVTIHLIGINSAESLGMNEQKYIIRELQASLYNGKANTRSGVLGVVLPDMMKLVYLGKCDCSKCGGSHSNVNINDSTVIREFKDNYFVKEEGKCNWSEDERYCVLVSWDLFKDSPEEYIEKAFEKRGHPISNKVTVYSTRN